MVVECRSTNAAKRVDLSTAQNSSGQVLTESLHKCISSRSSVQNVPFSFVFCSRLQRSAKLCEGALEHVSIQNTEKTMEHS